MAAVEPIRDWHRIAVEMLMTDADLGLQTIAEVFEGDDKDAVARLIRNTREVYDSILAKRKNLVLSDDDAAVLNGKVDRLRARLKFLGEAV